MSPPSAPPQGLRAGACGGELGRIERKARLQISAQSLGTGLSFVRGNQAHRSPSQPHTYRHRHNRTCATIHAPHFPSSSLWPRASITPCLISLTLLRTAHRAQGALILMCLMPRRAPRFYGLLVQQGRSS